MTKNATAETMNRSQQFRRMMFVTDTDKAWARRALVPIFAVLFIVVSVVLAWQNLVPLPKGPANDSIPWNGVDELLVSERMFARNGKQWNAGFTLSADNERVLAKLDIKLIPQQGISAPALDRQKQIWLQGIEETWNNRFYLQLPDQRLIPIILAVNFKTARTHHEVVVRRGSSSPNQHNWYMNTSADVVAHEIGHMLGAYDEYRTGATSPLPVEMDGTSLMGKRAGDGVPRVRHLNLLRERLTETTGVSPLAIVQPGAELRE